MGHPIRLSKAALNIWTVIMVIHDHPLARGLESLGRILRLSRDILVLT